VERGRERDREGHGERQIEGRKRWRREGKEREG